MGPAVEIKIISALTGPSTLGELADRIGVRAKDVLTVLAILETEGTVKRQGKLFWLARP